MGIPTRFPFGITTDKINKLFGMCPLPDPLRLFVVSHDFVAPQELDSTNVWTVTKTEAGSSSASMTIEDINYGVLKITNDNADNDNVFYQTTDEIIKFVAGKKLWFKARFAVSDATQSDLIMGLQIRDTTPLNVTDGVFFQKDDGDAYLDFHVEKDDTSTDASAVATMSNDVYIEVGFYYNGVDAIEYYIDGEKKGTLSVTNLPDDEELTISFGIQNGEAASKTMYVDYILLVSER